MKFPWLALACLALSGCLLPEAPKDSSFDNVQKSSLFTVYTMDRKHDSAPPVEPGERPDKMLPTTKNLIFITADNFTGKQFAPQLAAAYRTDNPPTLNEVTWWQFAPLFRDLYKKVAYLPLSQAHNANIMAALKYMEKQPEPYDLIIMSHGLPNFLTDGDPGYFMSFREIDAMKGQLHKLNLVFMQACFGQSLAWDWIDAGAKKVMAFDGFNRNFFFVSIFLDHHRWYSDEQAFYTANRDMQSELNHKKLYNFLITKGLNMSVDDYLKQADEPILTTPKSQRPAAPAPAPGPTPNPVPQT